MLNISKLIKTLLIWKDHTRIHETRVNKIVNHSQHSAKKKNHNIKSTRYGKLGRAILQRSFLVTTASNLNLHQSLNRSTNAKDRISIGDWTCKACTGHDSVALSASRQPRVKFLRSRQRASRQGSPIFGQHSAVYVEHRNYQ